MAGRQDLSDLNPSQFPFEAFEATPADSTPTPTLTLKSPWKFAGNGISLVTSVTGTTAALASANPILLVGQIGFETDTLSFKIGDGTTAYNSLKYFKKGKTSWTPTIEAVTTPPTFGTYTAKGSWWIGDGQLQLEWTLNQTAIGGAAPGSGVYLIPIPAGFTADTTYISVDDGTTYIGSTVGVAHFHSNASGGNWNAVCTVMVYDSTRLCIVLVGGNVTGPSFGVPSYWNNSNFAPNVGVFTISLRASLDVLEA